MNAKLVTMPDALTGTQTILYFDHSGIFVSSDEVRSIHLSYGSTGQIDLEFLSRQLVAHQHVEQSPQSARELMIDALANPIDFPHPKHLITPGDVVVVVIEDDLPEVADLVAAMWEMLKAAGVAAENVTFLQPARWIAVESPDPLAKLPEDVRAAVTLKRHEPTEEDGCAYLANTAAGERAYLARELVEADAVYMIGLSQFDPLLGHRGGASSLFPGLSDLETVRRTIGQGHEELSPDDPRPMRDIVDEVAWLLGVQYIINVIPGANRTVQQVIAGHCNSVARSCRNQLNHDWRFQLKDRAELVLVTVADNNWGQIARALNTARRVVEKDGRIVILSELDVPLTMGLEALKQSRTPTEALKPVRKSMPFEWDIVSQIARAVDWANVYLLSREPTEVIDDLFMVPLSTNEEVLKLLDQDDSVAIIENANLVYAEC